MSSEKAKPKTPTTILHIVGSPDSPFYFKLTIFYASSCKEYGSHVSFRYAVVHPGGLWSFPKSLQNVELNGKVTLDQALSNISHMKPDVIIHHLFCKRGHSEYRGIIESLNIPILGSSAEVTSISQSKSKTRDVLLKHGVRVPEGRTVTKDDDVELLNNDICFPCVVKPDMAEDSKGVSLVRKPEQLIGALEKAYKHGNTAVVERFIAGREIRVGLLSDSNSSVKVLPSLEYLDVKRDDIRGFTDKYHVDEKGMPIGKAACSRPVLLDQDKEPELIQRLSEYGKSAYRALQLRDFGVFDIRVDEEGIPWILEVNLFCSCGEKSVIVAMAKSAGISCDELLSQMVENALARSHSVDAVA